jgi:hypothetical protein
MTPEEREELKRKFLADLEEENIKDLTDLFNKVLDEKVDFEVIISSSDTRGRTITKVNH